MSATIRTTISLPTKLLKQADRLAAKKEVSRSQAFAQAMEAMLEKERVLELQNRLEEAYADGLDDDERAWLRFGADQMRKASERDPWKG